MLPSAAELDRKMSTTLPKRCQLKAVASQFVPKETPSGADRLSRSNIRMSWGISRKIFLGARLFFGVFGSFFAFRLLTRGETPAHRKAGEDKHCRAHVAAVGVATCGRKD